MKNNIFILCLLTSVFLFSQESTSFRRKKTFYLNGDARVIGNNILSKDATRSFNNSRVQNNDVKMVYVDIDKDPQTFSSSSAILKLPDNLDEIAYASLYWSGTYTYDKVFKKRVGREYEFVVVDSTKSNDFNVIKLKTPGASYKTVRGSVIFDGAKSEKHKENSPYVCYADVTNILKSAKTKSGLYTVANIRASLGQIPGGSSAGWMLYVVYKSPTKYPKYITTYSGFKYVEKKKPITIKYKNHESSAEVDDIKTSLVIAAMEGDATLNGDECAIYNPKKGYHLSLSSGYRRRNNFFTSSVSTSQIKSIDRNPSSSNTLGYDLVELDLKNTKEELIIKNNNNTLLRFKTLSDEFFVFFTAFKTEIQKEINVNTPPPVKTTVVENTSKKNEERKSNKLKTDKKVKAEKRAVTSKTDSKKTENTLTGDALYDKLINEKSMIVTDVRSGYYVISNTVTNEKSAQSWIKKLKDAGFRARRFKKPYENTRYVYTFVSVDLNTALEKLKELQKNPKFKTASILKINME